IIGAGTAGMSAFNAARKVTDSLVMLEGGAYGTTCARVGCMPSKLLIAAAESAHQMQLAPTFGIQLNAGYKVDGKAVMHRVKAERDRFVGFVLQDIEKIPAEQRLDELAHFIDANTLETTSGKKIQARNIIIATGSRPAVPAMFEAAGDRLIINDDVFAWDDLPESVAMFGPGVIGLEISQALSRLGVRLRLFGRGDGIGPLQDPEIKALALKTFNQEFPIMAGNEVRLIKRTDAGVAITFVDNDGTEVTETYDYLLAATGRTANLDKINIEAAGLKLNKRLQPELNPETSQCINADGSPSHIFIAGDVANFRPLLHEANDEGFIAGSNAARWPNFQPTARRTPLAVVFSEPQIALAGESLAQIQARLGEEGVVVGSMDFSRQGRARVMQQNKGLMKIYACKKTGQLLGTEIFGPRAEHLVHLLVWSIQQKLTLKELLEQPFYHPVLEEGVRTALRSAASQLKKSL
ncbi:MAG: dihydrolipoyl dehydrogenase, partial [Pseudomonadaceae bacterium]|nr:dihydrolipoyl dehydrogenase [Pseudomonadaceae bacterium]